MEGVTCDGARDGTGDGSDSVVNGVQSPPHRLKKRQLTNIIHITSSTAQHDCYFRPPHLNQSEAELTNLCSLIGGERVIFVVYRNGFLRSRTMDRLVECFKELSDNDRTAVVTHIWILCMLYITWKTAMLSTKLNYN